MDNTEVRGLSQNCAELKNRSQQRTFRSCCPVQLSSTVVTRHRKLLKLINFYKMKNSGSQSHQPRFKCSVATCSEVWIQKCLHLCRHFYQTTLLWRRASCEVLSHILDLPSETGRGMPGPTQNHAFCPTSSQSSSRSFS